MTSPDQFDYSLTCSVCGVQIQGKAESPFVFIVSARVNGWEVPDAVQNKPIKCPSHK
jgi:hypothetical protein